MILLLWLAALAGSAADTATPSSKCWMDSSTRVIRYKLDVTGPSIHNSTSRHVDLLMNSVQGYLGGHFCPNFRLPTECLACEPFTPTRGGLVFANHFMFGPDSARYSAGGARIDSGSKPLPRFQVTKRRSEKKSFPAKTVMFRYAGPSCDDADLVNVEIRYPDGAVRLDSVLDPSFFEYDLDADSEPEQFVFGSRDCSQEMVLFRIAKNSSDLGAGMPEPFRALLREFRTDYEITRTPQSRLAVSTKPIQIREYLFKRKRIGIDAQGVRSFPRFALQFVWSDQEASWKKSFEENLDRYRLACPNLRNRTDCEAADKTTPTLLVRMNSGYVRMHTGCEDSASLVLSLKRRALAAVGESKGEFLDIGCSGPFHWNTLDSSDPPRDTARKP